MKTESQNPGEQSPSASDEHIMLTNFGNGNSQFIPIIQQKQKGCFNRIVERFNQLNQSQKLIILLMVITTILFITSNKQQKKSVATQPQLQNNLYKLNRRLQQFLSSLRYYDLSYFIDIDDEPKQAKQVQIAKQNLKQERDILQLTNSQYGLQDIISSMKKPKYRVDTDQSKNDERMKDLKDLSYFFYELSNEPQNINYLQAQYYRYDKLYNIGKYGKELPLCVVVVGKNNQNTILKMYDSIFRQNYTNYRVVHVDDNSNDRTIDITLKYLSTKLKFRDRVTIITQQYQRNALYNRNYGIINYCQEDDIVIDIDTDDWIIGKQVFQLVNAIYQTGNVINGKRQQLWCAYFTNIVCCPNFYLYGEVPSIFIEKQTYRSEATWRTTQLRTYLWKLYDKVDKSEFIDQYLDKKEQFHAQTYDSFMNSPMFEMSAPQHIRFLDEFVYFYTGSPRKEKYLQLYYSTVVAQTLPPYSPLQNLKDDPTRNLDFKPNYLKSKQLKQRTAQIIQKRKVLKEKVDEYIGIYQIHSNDNKLENQIQQRIKVHEDGTSKKFGRTKQLCTNLFNLTLSNISQADAVIYKELGISESIQVGSPFDFNLTDQINFDQLESNLFKSLSHQILTFKQNLDLSVEPVKFKYEVFKNQNQIQNYIENLIIKDPVGQDVKDFQYYLGSRLAMQYIDQTSKQLEYYYLNKKYKIQNNQKQVPICVFSASYKSFSQNKFRGFFNSVERMNYTNYHIVWVDDFSPDNSAYAVYNYVKNSKMDLRFKLKIIHNLQHVGVLGNMHLYIKNYCKSDDVVLICDGDDAFIGTQSFQVLSAIYRDPNTWFTYSRFLMTTDQVDQFSIGPSSKQLTIPVIQHRITNQFWGVSHLRSFRKKVMDSVPLEQFLYYRYDKVTGLACPRYYGSSADRFQVYAHIQICGDERIKYLTDFLYLYQAGITNQCYRIHQIYDQYKSRIKYPIKKASSLGEKSKTSKNYATPTILIEKLKQIYLMYLKCKTQGQFPKYQ